MDVGMTLGAGYGESRVLNRPKLINDLRPLPLVLLLRVFVSSHYITAFHLILFII